MKISPLKLCLLALTFTAPAPAQHAPLPEPPPAPAMSPKVNPLSFADGNLVFDVDWRMRLEWRENDRDFDNHATGLQDTDVLLLRTRLGGDWRPVSWIRLRAQAQDARETLSDRGRTPRINGAQGNAPLDLFQGYLELADYNAFPVGLKLGRQTFFYGDGRIIADSNWGNFGRSFDAVRVRYQGAQWWSELFWAGVVEPRRNGFDKRKNGEYVTGAYLSSQHLPEHIVDLYGIYFSSDSGNAAGDDTTWGARLTTEKKRDSCWDYTAEAALQTGKRNHGDDVVAMMLHGDVGYTWRDTSWSPRVGISYDYASGDSNGDNRHWGTFRAPYTCSHPFYGRQDIIGLANLHNPRLTLAVKPTELLKVALEYNIFWLADTADFAYTANGVTPIRRQASRGGDVRASGASRYFGQEVDLIIDYTLAKNVLLHAGISYFFAGSYLADTGASDDGLFCYVQTTLKF